MSLARRWRTIFAVILTLALAASGLGGGTASAEEGIHEVSVTDESVTEGNAGIKTMTFQVTMNLPALNPVWVKYRTEDITAQSTVIGASAADFVAATGTIKFESGQTQKTISITVHGDTLPEPSERFRVVLFDPINASIRDGEGIGTIENDDEAPVSISINDVTVAESAGTASFTITQSAVSTQDTRVEYTTTDGTATAGSDYTSASPGAVATIPAGSTSTTVSIPILEDDVDEADETFTVSFVGTEAANAAFGESSSGTATITDNEATPVVSITNDTVNEGDPAEFTVTVSGRSDRDITVTWETRDGSATAGSDYEGDTGTLTFPADTAPAPRTITVQTSDDDLDEVDETFDVALTPDADATCEGGDCTGTATITDEQPTPVIAISDAAATEGVGDLVFTVTLNGKSGSKVTVDYSTGATGDTATGGTDYTSSTGTVTFEPGDQSETITIPVADDSIDEPDTETMTVTLSAPSGATCDGEGADCEATGTITDNDSPPTVTVSDGQGSETDAAADPDPVVFTLTLSQASEKPVTITYSTGAAAGGDADATPTADYTPASGATVTFQPGETSKDVTIDVVDDELVEGTEDFALDVTASPGGCTNGDCTGVGKILDDETPQLTIVDADASEGDSPGTTTMTFTVVASRTSDNDITATYDLSDGTAMVGEDYTDKTGTVTIEAGKTSGSFDVTIVADNFAEPDEYFLATLSNAVGAAIADGEATGTIHDDDAGTPAVLSIADASVVEGTGGTTTMTFKVTKAQPNPLTTQTVTVHYRTRDRAAGTQATAGTDYVAVEDGTVTFGPTETEKDIQITIVSDDDDELDERFEVELFDASNATISDAVAIGTIEDDDGPTVSVEDADDVVEGDSVMAFVVRLSEPSVQTVTVEFSTAGGTATGGDDYVSQTDTFVTFAPGDVEQTVDVTINEDAEDEADETVEVELSNATDATIGQATASGTIVDDDGPTISISDPTAVVEDEGAIVRFVVTLSAASPQEVTVQARTVDDTATAGEDYAARALTTITFAPSETEKEFDVLLTEDELDELDEHFTVELSDPTNATIQDGSGKGTITDDDVEPTVSIADQTVTEGTGAGTTPATFTITLSAASGRDVTVQASTVDGGSASPGSDYTALPPTTVTFEEGQTEKTVTVAVARDNFDEGSETFLVELSGANGATIDDGTATGTISDDDPTPTIAINDVTVAEGNTGTVEAIFTVSLSGPSSTTITVKATTAGGSATSPQDYSGYSNRTVTFAPGDTTEDVVVVVHGDAVDEPNETFNVVLSDASDGHTITDTTGTATITDDDPTPAATTTTTAPNNGGSSTQGYSLVGEDGSLYAFGTAKNVGDMKGKALNAPIIGVAYTPGGNGYWLVAKDGGIFTFGDAEFFGSMGGSPINSPVIGMAATPTGKGYWLFAGDGGIFTFGDAKFFGSMGDQKLNAPVINMEPLESGNGYWLVAADGGIFTFGLAEFFGSMGDKKINQPVFDMTSTDTDGGYWLVARDGGIFSFGDAEPKFYGSAVNEFPRPTKVIGMDSTPGSLGYWIADASGKVYEYGNAEDLGDRYFSNNPAPMISFASVPGLKP